MKLWEWLKAQPTGGKIAMGVAAFVVVVGIGAAIEGDDEPPKRDRQEVIREGQEELRAVEAEQRRQDRKAKPKPVKDAADPEPSTEEVERQVEEEITPGLLVDVMEATEPSSIRQMCRMAPKIGEEAALQFFELGYGEGNPVSGPEVFDEIMARC